VSDLNKQINRAVWFDIPVADLDRASAFYENVLAIKVQKETFGEFQFAVLEHDQGNGGCLVISPETITGDKGIMLYLNVNGRLEDAVGKAEKSGGKIVEPIQAMGPHGFRSVILDSEGNRVVLHSA
jgi:predicted enzyme related to lactoylglutathione lyase